MKRILERGRERIELQKSPNGKSIRKKVFSSRRYMV